MDNELIRLRRENASLRKHHADYHANCRLNPSLNPVNHSFRAISSTPLSEPAQPHHSSEIQGNKAQSQLLFIHVSEPPTKKKPDGSDVPKRPRKSRPVIVPQVEELDTALKELCESPDSTKHTAAALQTQSTVFQRGTEAAEQTAALIVQAHCATTHAQIILFSFLIYCVVLEELNLLSVEEIDQLMGKAGVTGRYQKRIRTGAKTLFTTAMGAPVIDHATLLLSISLPPRPWYYSHVTPELANQLLGVAMSSKFLVPHEILVTCSVRGIIGLWEPSLEGKWHELLKKLSSVASINNASDEQAITSMNNYVPTPIIGFTSEPGREDVHSNLGTNVSGNGNTSCRLAVVRRTEESGNPISEHRATAKRRQLSENTIPALQQLHSTTQQQHYPIVGVPEHMRRSFVLASPVGVQPTEPEEHGAQEPWSASPHSSSGQVSGSDATRVDVPPTYVSQYLEKWKSIEGWDARDFDGLDFNLNAHTP